MNRQNSQEPDRPDQPVAFVQTATSQLFASLDRWRQVGEEEARLAYEMVLRNELSGGTPVVREFEQAWRDYTGLKHALTTCNGTAAIYSALFGLGVGPGDEVICPVYTWLCTISPALFLGARPIFCECDPRTMQMDPEDLRRRMTPRTKAIIVVHLWGWVADMDAIMAIAREKCIPVIEDCSHAHGARYRDRIVGSIGDIGVWSMQGTKPLSAGEGGMLATNNAEAFDRACLLGQVNRMAGLDLQAPSLKKYQPLGLGLKFRAHPVAIGIALVQFKKLAALNERRRRYVEAVEAGLAAIPGLDPVPSSAGSTRGGYYAFPVHFRGKELGGCALERFCELLTAEGIPANGSPYAVLHHLPIFQDGFDIFTGGRGVLTEGWAGFRADDFPVTCNLVANLLFLPMLSDPVPDAAEQILAAIRRAAERAGSARTT